MAYFSSFNGYGMEVVGPATGRDSGADVSERHMPGGATTYIDIGGPTTQRLSLTLFFVLAADYEQLVTQRGQVGTLSFIDGSYTALLVKVQRTTRNLATGGETHATAEFILL